MPRKRSQVDTNCVQTSRKQDDEDGTSQVSVTSHSSASSQATLDGDKADQASIQEPLPSRPSRAAKVKCHEQLLVDASNNSESAEDDEQHLKRKAQNVSKSRCNESVEVRKQHVKKKRKYSAMMISKETPEQRERRLETVQRYLKKKKANESVELRKQRLEKRRKYSAILRSKESDEHRERRLERMRRNNNKRKANETVEDRKRRLEYNREYWKKYKANETAEHRERRLEKVRQYDLLRRTNPNVEQRELRRQKQREYVAKCKAKKRIKKYCERAKNRQKRANRARIEQYYITEDSDDDFESIKSETSNEETERFFFSSASTSISDPLLAPRPTRAAKVKCLQQISEAVSEDSSGDESPLANLRRFQQQQGAEVQGRLKEIQQCGPKCGVKDSSEQREPSEEKLRQLAIKSVDALRVKCQKINIRQYVPKYRIKKSVVKDEQHLPKTIEDGIQTVSENVEKHELQEESTRIASETIEQHEQASEKQHEVYLRDKEGDSKDAGKHIKAIEEIKSEASNQEYDQLCEVTTSEGIEYPKRNVNGEDNKLCECDPLGGISGINVKSEDNVLEEEYEVQKVIKMEIDIESEGPQQIKPEDRTKTMVDAITVKGINDIVQKPLAKQRKRNKHNATNTLTTRRDTGKKRKKKLRSAPQQSLEKPRQDGPILIHDRNFVRGSYQNILLQYVLSSRTENSVAQGEKHLLKLIECVSSQTANDHVDHDHQFPSKYKPNESVEQRQLYPDTEKQPCTIKLKDDLIDEQRNEYARQHYLNLKPNENVEEREQSPDKASQYQSKLMANETVEQSAKNICQDGPVGVAPVNKLREPLRNHNIGQCELEHQDIKSVENNLPCPDKLPQDEPESRILESFQLIQPHRTIYIQQYVPEQQIGETDEQHQQRIEKLRSELICKVNECIDKYERQNEESNSAITLNTLSNAEKRLKTHPENMENLYDKSNPEEVNQILQNLRQRVASKSIQRYPITKSTIHGSYVSDKEITSGPSKEKHKQLCEVTASEGLKDPKPNMNGDVVYEFDSLDIITSNTIRTGDTVVEEKYEVRRVLNMEIDVESKGVQLTTLNENNLMTENSKVQDIIDDVMQKLLEDEQQKDDVNATCTDTTTENRCSEKLHKYLANESVVQRENCLERLVDGQKCIPNERAEQCLNNIKNGARSIANESFVQSEQPCTSQCLIYEYAKRQRLLKENRNNKARSQMANETDEQRQRRLEKKRQYYLTKVKGKRLSNESAEKREQRLRKIREYRLKRNANETVEQRERRLERIRQYVAKRRANPTEQCERVRIRQREYPKICNTKKKNEKLVQRPEYLQQNGSSGNVEQYHAEEDIKYDSVKEIESAPCQEQKQFCEVTASKSIPDPKPNSNSKANVLHEFV